MKPNLPKLLACSKTVLSLILCLLFFIQTFAQAPANDNCSGAITLVSSTSCNPTTGTLINATRMPAAFTYTSNSSWTVPAGGAGMNVAVECWGGGGAGGGVSVANNRGGGGGGGAYTISTFPVGLVGFNYPVVVGTGGAGFTGAGAAGTVTTFNNPLNFPIVQANPGYGGGIGNTGGGGAGGAAGTYSGGAGGTGATAGGGGGGGAAGSLAVGGAGGNPNAYTAGLGTFFGGGDGGVGLSSTNAPGNPGLSYGGGGGGSRRGGSGGSAQIGGRGADGFVRITYPVGCGNVNSPDVWYKFVAQTTHPNIALSNMGWEFSGKDPRIELYASCGAISSLACSTNPMTLGTAYPTGLTIGNTYYIRITTNSNFAPPTTGAYSFDICVTDLKIDYGKSYANITDGTVGGTINQGDVLEIRTTLVVSNGYWDELRSIYNISFNDTIKAGNGFILQPNNISTRTNEGKIYKSFTDAFDSDAGWYTTSGTDTIIRINIGAGATNLTGGTLTATSYPNFANNCIIMATYRVKVNAMNNTKINFGGGAFRYATTPGGPLSTIYFPNDSLIVYPTLAACSDAVSPGNLIGNAANGTFGTLTTGSNPSFLQNGGPAAVNTTYGYKPLSSNGPNDYFYSIANNTSATNAIVQTVPKGDPSRVFTVFDITGDHTGATNTARGNLPCDTTKPVSPTNPCGYLMIINAAYRPDVAFEYTATGACAETYYEVSAWFKNICYKCGSDSLSRSSGDAGYIPTAAGDTSGVRPNIAMKIDGVDYYTTGELVYQGLGGTQSGSDTLNNWVRRAFVFKTGAGQTSFKVTFRNNAPGGGGNDWAIDDIGLRTCYPTMTYAPPNPIVFMGSPLTISDTVRSYFNSYSYYQWEVKPFGGSWTTIAGASGNAIPVFNPIYNQFEYVISYTIPGSATLQANAGDLYRMVVASSLPNLTNGCNYTPSVSFTLLPTDASCLFSSTNFAVAPQTGSINWNKLNWSLGHIPTCCESAHITYNGTNAGADAVTVDITNDICIINLTLLNSSPSGTNKLFKTILHPGYSMQMNGNVQMGANGLLPTDSCIFIAKGGGTITVNGNTTIGYPSENATCIIGSAPGTTTHANYMFKGNSLTFNTKAFTNHKFMAVTLNPTSGSATLVNNTNAVLYPTAVAFDTLKIGIGRPKTVTCSGSTQNVFMNDNKGSLVVSDSSTLILPANYTINAKDFQSPGTYKSAVSLKPNSILQLGGGSGGIAGSNFPANFSSYSLAPTSTVIFDGASQTIPGTVNNVNAYGNITLTGTGVKTATSSNIILAGNLYRKNGGHTFNANGGRVNFITSINAQKYYADAGATPIDFYDFTNNNTHSSGLSIDSTIGILNELELMPSTKITLNTGDIIIRSSAARTANVVNLGTTIPSIVYNTTYRFVVERYLYAKLAWRLLATPVVIAGSPTVAQAWREGNSALTSNGYGTMITGPTGPFGAATNVDAYTQRWSLKGYNSATDAWDVVTNTNTTLANTKGIAVFVIGDRGKAVGAAAGPTNLRIKGQIRTGNQVFNVPSGKFEMFGNPYPSRIDFRTVTKSNIANAFIVWNPSIAGLYNVGGYESYVLNAGNYRLNGSGAIRNYIESGEAVFVQSNAAGPGSVTVKESDKGLGSALVNRAGVTIPTLEINMYAKDATGADYLADGVMLNFDAAHSAGVDNMDVRKIMNTYDNVAIKNGNFNLVVERRPNLTITDTIKLNTTGLRVASYRFEIDPSVLNNTGLDAFLKDKFLQTETAISFGAVTTVAFEATADAASRVADRFMIVFKQAPTTNFTTISATRNADKTVTVNWGTAAERNVTNYTIEQSNDGINFTAIGTQAATANNGTNPTYNKQDATASNANNWYRVKANNTNGTTKYTAIAMVGAVNDATQIAAASMSIYPNPIEGGNVNLHLNNQVKGNYTVQISNAAGQQIQVANVQVENNNTLRVIKLGTVATGNYQATVTDEVGTKTTINFIVK
jgi:hypothetical protein